MSTQEDESEQFSLTKCEVCGELEDHGRATEFVLLPCGHDWCLNCLKNAFMTASQPPKCFTDDCKGEEIEATTEILDLVGPEVASRYLQARMEHEADIIENPYVSMAKKLAKMLAKMLANFFAKKCPVCKSLVELTEGCYNMHCRRCGCNFCYTCGTTDDCECDTEDCECGTEDCECDTEDCECVIEDCECDK